MEKLTSSNPFFSSTPPTSPEDGTVGGASSNASADLTASPANSSLEDSDGDGGSHRYLRLQDSGNGDDDRSADADDDWWRRNPICGRCGHRYASRSDYIAHTKKHLLPGDERPRELVERAPLLLSSFGANTASQQTSFPFPPSHNYQYSTSSSSSSSPTPEQLSPPPSASSTSSSNSARTFGSSGTADYFEQAYATGSNDLQYHRQQPQQQVHHHVHQRSPQAQEQEQKEQQQPRRFVQLQQHPQQQMGQVSSAHSQQHQDKWNGGSSPYVPAQQEATSAGTGFATQKSSNPKSSSETRAQHSGQPGQSFAAYQQQAVSQHPAVHQQSHQFPLHQQSTLGSWLPPPPAYGGHHHHHASLAASAPPPAGALSAPLVPPPLPQATAIPLQGATPGSYPFTCDVCLYPCGQPDILWSHVLAFHPERVAPMNSLMFQQYPHYAVAYQRWPVQLPPRPPPQYPHHPHTLKGLATDKGQGEGKGGGQTSQQPSASSAVRPKCKYARDIVQHRQANRKCTCSHCMASAMSDRLGAASEPSYNRRRSKEKCSSRGKETSSTGEKENLTAEQLKQLEASEWVNRTGYKCLRCDVRFDKEADLVEHMVKDLHSSAK